MQASRWGNPILHDFLPPSAGPHRGGDAFLGLAPRLLGSQPSVQRTLLLTPGSLSPPCGTGHTRLPFCRHTEGKAPTFPGPRNSRLQPGFLGETEGKHWSGHLSCFVLLRACWPAGGTLANHECASTPRGPTESSSRSQAQQNTGFNSTGGSLECLHLRFNSDLNVKSSHAGETPLNLFKPICPPPFFFFKSSAYFGALSDRL